ncbi:DUF805 domain-containing protein [Bradyrhizobium sp. 131]|uniref:DUF805 domain-containing protein n=1 Tax=Bradyrhizobium sp. 131 TaxID=2782609 RepID=UPI0020002FF6|nr:DUF805 domain-containing protein [Bradyrhizobium sp. 131]UPK20321.1 DUF805 domain-containing protein [Bradyrhizobium sp. 131]
MDVLQAFFSFRGRINRCEYSFVLVGALVTLAIAFIATASHLKGLTGISIILCKWMLLAALAKRFHDVGWSGWCCLLSFVPMVGIVTYFVLLGIEGTSGPNKYGSVQTFFLNTAPKERRFTDAGTQLSPEAAKVLKAAEERGIRVIVKDASVFIDTKYYWYNSEIVEYGRSLSF